MRNFLIVILMFSYNVLLNGMDQEKASSSMVNQRETINCCICTEDIEPENTKTLLCNHQFHPDCINGWIAARLLNPICPLCKRKIENNSSKDISSNLLASARDEETASNYGSIVASRETFGVEDNYATPQRRIRPFINRLTQCLGCCFGVATFAIFCTVLVFERTSV